MALCVLPLILASDRCLAAVSRHLQEAAETRRGSVHLDSDRSTPSWLARKKVSWSGTTCSAGYEWTSEKLAPMPSSPPLACTTSNAASPCRSASQESSLEPGEPAAIHPERGSGYERGIIRGQKGNRCRNVLGLAHHARVDLLGARLHVRVIPQHGGVNRARQDDVDTNALGLALNRGRPGERDDGGFCGSVGCHQWLGHDCVNAGHIHNRTARLHGQERLFGEVHRSEEIDIEDLLPVLRREFLKGLESHQPSVVDDHIKPTKAVHRRFHGACNLRLRGHIACHPECIGRAGFTHVGSAFLGGVALQIGNDDARALGPETLRGGEADPARRAGNNGDFIAKAHSTTLPPACAKLIDYRRAFAGRIEPATSSEQATAQIAGDVAKS